jgi:hypothetical protein
LRLIRLSDLDALAAKYDAPNGWGDVPSAIKFLEQVLAACKKPLPPPPSEIVSVWR